MNVMFKAVTFQILETKKANTLLESAKNDKIKKAKQIKGAFMKKKLLSILLFAAIVSSMLVGCGETKEAATNAPTTTDTPKLESDDSLEGVHIFMFKSTGNSFGNLMYEGFAEYMSAKGEKTANKSPDEITVEAQVEILEELISQKVASITISTNGENGYDEVFKKAKESGIPIVSVDSEVNPAYRVCHIDQVDTSHIGSYLIQAAVLITLGIDYPGDILSMKCVVEDALTNYSGKEIQLGILSASVDTPIQNAWIVAMEEELSDACYAGKVSATLDIKYGNDDPIESTTEAYSFVVENKVDCIIAPTTVGIAAAGNVLKNSDSHIKLTGLGLPSEMQSFMPATPEDNALDFICPYMMLWDVIHLGATAGAATYVAVYDGFTGEIGTTFKMDAFRDYAPKTYEAYKSGEGTAILADIPYVFYKYNMAEWNDVL